MRLPHGQIHPRFCFILSVATLLIGVSIILTPLLITVENPLISVEKGVEKYLHGQIEYAGFKVGCARAGRHINMGTFEGKSTQAEQL